MFIVCKGLSVCCINNEHVAIFGKEQGFMLKQNSYSATMVTWSVMIAKTP